MKLGWAIANLGAAAVKRDLFRACSGGKKDGKTWQVPQSPTRCPGWLQSLPRAEPSTPRSENGACKCWRGVQEGKPRGAKGFFKRCLALDCG